MSWYYARGEEQVGPVEDAEFETLVNSGIVTEETLVWQPGMGDWQSYGAVRARQAGGSPAVAVAPATAQERVCASCGRVLPVSEMLEYQGEYVCATCKPLYFQRIREGVVLERGFRYAGFWIRLLAIIIDSLILMPIGMVLMVGYFIMISTVESEVAAALAYVGLNILSMGINIAYETFFIGRFGATLGKMVVRIRVVTADGGRVTYLRAFARFWAKFISGLVLLIGYIMAAFDSQKRALHDYICDTRVIHG